MNKKQQNVNKKSSKCDRNFDTSVFTFSSFSKNIKNKPGPSESFFLCVPHCKACAKLNECRGVECGLFVENVNIKCVYKLMLSVPKFVKI